MVLMADAGGSSELGELLGDSGAEPATTTADCCPVAKLHRVM